MGILALLAVLGYMAAASDPCNSPELHRGLCVRPVYGPAPTQVRPLDEYRRTEFGVLMLHRADPTLPGVQFVPLRSSEPQWVACDLADGGCF